MRRSLALLGILALAGGACREDASSSVRVASTPKKTVTPTASLAIHVSPAELRLVEGQTATVTVGLDWTSGSVEPVSLSTDPLGSNVTIDLGPMPIEASVRSTTITITRTRGGAPGKQLVELYATSTVSGTSASVPLALDLPSVAGQLDDAYGDHGIVRTSQRASAFGIDQDGTVYIARPSTRGPQVVRHFASGDLDPRFGTKGIAEAPVPLEPQAVVVKDLVGAILVGTAVDRVAALKLGSAGHEEDDVAFSPMVHDVGDGHPVVTGAVRRSQERLVVTGYSADSLRPFVVQLRNGVIDPTFAPSLLPVTRGVPSEPFYVAGDGTTVLSVTERGAGGAVFLTRLGPEGDSADYGMKLVVPDGGVDVHSVVPAADKTLLMLGTTADRRQAHVRHLRISDGALVTSFGEGGVVTYPKPAPTSTAVVAVASGAVVLPGGRMLVAVTLSDDRGSAVAVLAFAATGAIDASFADGGVLRIDLPSVKHETARFSDLQSGTVLVGVNTDDGVVLARFFY